MSNEEREDAINFFKEVAEKEVNNAKLTNCEDVNTHYKQALEIAIEALEQQKTGKWIDRSGGDPTDSNVSCNLCNKWFHQSTNYCPNCGAKMEDKNEK